MRNQEGTYLFTLELQECVTEDRHAFLDLLRLPGRICFTHTLL